MAVTELAAKFMIGASLSSGFGVAFGNAKKKLGDLGDAVKQLSRQQGLIERFERDQAALEKTRLAMGKATAELRLLKAALRANPQDQGAAKAMALAEARAGKLAAALDRQKAALRGSQSAMAQAGATVSNYGSRYHELGRAIDQARAKRAKLHQALTQKEGAAAQLGTLHTRALGMAGGVLSAMGLGALGADFEHQLRLFGNVANLTNAELGAIGQTLNRLATQTNQDPGALLGALSDLAAKGLDPTRALASLGAIGRTATATGAEIGDVASTAFSLIDAMGLTPEALPQALDVLAQAGKEGAFELKNMAQYFPMLTAQAKSLGMAGMEGVATLGAALQVAMKGAADPSTAANNFQNFLAKLTAPDTVKKLADLGVSVEDVMKGAQARGENPVLAMLAEIEAVTGGDKFRISEIFGDMQVKAFLDPMMANLKEFERIRQESLGARGVVDADFAAMMATAREQFGALRIAVGQLGTAFGTSLLPALKLGAWLLTGIVRPLASLVETMPWLGTLVAGAAVGWGLYTVGAAAAAAKTWLFSAALLDNPLGWWIAGIGLAIAAGTLLWQHWDQVTAWFASKFDWFESKFEWLGNFFGGASWVDPAQSAAAAPAAALPALPPPAAGAQVSTTINAPISITVAAGKEREMADEIARALAERERAAAARARGALYDG